MRIANNGNVAINSTNTATYKLNVNGSLNATDYKINGLPLNIGYLSQGMTVQTKHLTYTQMDVKDTTGWDAINDNISTGFVIAITPSSISSKILVNMIAHIGTNDNGTDSRWWGIKLYRKIGAGAWTEVTGANGTETGAAANTAGTPVWVSHNLGSTGADWPALIANVTGTYLDAPATTSIVYYTAYWNQKLIEASSIGANIYINRAHTHNDANRPAPSSSWTATEIWDLGTPYTPPTGDTTITIASSSVGVGATPNANHKLIVNQGTSGTTGVTCFPLKISAGAYSSQGNGTATLIGLGTENSSWSKCAIGHTRKGVGYDVGDIVFLCNNIIDSSQVSMTNEKMRIASDGNVGIGTTSPTNKLQIVHSSTAANSDTAGGIGLYVYNPTNTTGHNSVIINRIAGSAAGKVLYGFDVSAAYGFSIYMLGSSSNLRFNNGWDGAGTDVMQLSTTGNLAIGTTPHATYKLDVNGTINATSVLVGGAAISGSKWTNGATATNIYYNSGNVSIGATTTSDADDNTTFAIPTATLFVKGGASVGGTCDVVIRGGAAGSNNGKARLWLTADASHSSYIQSEHTISGNTQLTFGTAIGNVLPAERMIIGTDGCLYINNTNYENASATAGFKLLVSGSDSNGICAKFFHPNRSQGIGIAFDGLAGLSANQNIVMKPSGTGNFQVQGNVGIGHTNPLYKCHIKMSYDNADTGLHLDAGEDNASTNKYTLTIWPYVIGGGEIGWRFRTQNLTGGINTPLTLNNYGNVVVAGNLNTASITCNGWLRTTGLHGLYSDTYACHFYPNDAQYGNWRINGNQVNGWSGLRFTDAEITVMAGNNGTKRCGFHYNTGTVGWGFYIDENRDAFCPGNITAYWSDRRLKTNLSKLSNFDNVLTSLTGYSFNWNEKGQQILRKSADELDIGLIAQDVQKVIPQAVRVNKAGMQIDEDESSFDYLTIHYDKIIPFLVEGYKYHKDIIEKQNKENNVLKQENNDLKQKYDILQQDMILIKKTLNLI